MEPGRCPRVIAAQFPLAERDSASEYCALAQGRKLVRAAPGDRSLPKEKEHDAKHEPHRDAKQEVHRAVSTPLPDASVELPPLIRRQEVVAIALVGLLVI